MSLRLVVVITTQPGRGQEQVEAFARLAPLVRAEAGCLQYDLHSVGGDPDRFVLLEEWASRAELDAHGRSPHMVEAGAANGGLRAGPAQVMVLSATPLV
ncbi:antibiotic biosynthesis monooxygenase [Rhodococcus antarcticus]|jgi:quinol monooxygenase YgiN|uniref:Antibiotic biosynthesis monooxygenase n=1 Tax=Rhodococcus antarcticus TaxID=2987751 RepID=A0ABY6NZB6_9NOCA|nr:putative quinol monooxygenase [Rhodococcus antarcticus]UZJ24745.1 antibiotic biosynthesis monooxygenase [Rhodococcus antarcticus]